MLHALRCYATLTCRAPHNNSLDIRFAQIALALHIIQIVWQNVGVTQPNKS